jgi:hypothetical protein
MAKLGLMQLVTVSLRATARHIERVLGRRQLAVGGVDTSLRQLESRLAVSEGCLARFQIELPGIHLLGQGGVGL